MCVVAFAWNAHPRWRLLLIGNRDEFHARPAGPLAPWPDSDVLAGRDLLAGGTWAGIAGNGRCAVVTNIRAPHAKAPAARSRGELPSLFLTGDRDVRAMVPALTARADDYAPFNLLLVDSRCCAHLGNHPDTGHAILAPGLYGMSNGGFDTPWPKVCRVKTVLGDWLAGDTEDPAPLWEVLRDPRPFPAHTLPDTGVGPELERRLSPVFIDGREYGTRASTIIAIDHDGAGWIAERRFGVDGGSIGQTRLSVDVASRPGNGGM